MKWNVPLLEGISTLTNTEISTINGYYNSIKNNVELENYLNIQYEKLNEYVSTTNLEGRRYAKDTPSGRINRQTQSRAGYFLYTIIRALKPEIVVETGVASGESSTFILQAMEDNGKGRLYSIDLPLDFNASQRRIIFPPGKTNGWVIPNNLRNRWKLELGPSQDLLLPLLQKLKKIDIFLHDSLHTYEHMMFEYNTCWDYLKDDGILISDDIAVMNEKGHSPFVDFTNMKNIKPIVHHVVGTIKKN